MKSPGGHRSSKKVTNGLVALSSAAVFTVYSAGYVRTRAAAERFARDGRDARDAHQEGREGRADSVAPPPAPRPIAPVAVAPPTPTVASAAPASTPAPANKTAPKKAEPSREPTSTTAVALSASTVAEASPAAAAAAPAATVPATDHPAVSADTKAAEPAPAPPQPQYKDGTYYGWGTSRHGDIQAYVIIESGHITTAAISQCLTRYSCSWIAHLPGQVIGRQSADVDYVTGATQSTNAFYYAILEALSKAK